MHTQKPSDERIIKRLQLLRPVTPRDPEAARSGRARFLAEVESMSKGVSESVDRRHIGWDEKIRTIPPRKERFSMIPMLTSIFVALVLFFGGAGATTFAAQNALPGDTLYSVKTVTEDLRLAMAASTSGEARLYNDFVQRRVGEIDSLAAKGRYDDIPVAASRLEAQVRQITQILAALAGEDPVQAQQLSTRLRESLVMQVQLKEHLRNGQAEFEFLGIVEVMNASSWTISGEVVAIGPDGKIDGEIETGDLVKVKALINEGGGLTAVQIQEINGQGRDAFNLVGIIESIEDGSWVVAGRVIHVTPQTKIRDSVAEGDYVEIDGVLAIDGSMVARTIRPAGEDDGNANGNSNGNDNDDGDNGNCAGENCNGNGNDDGDNGNCDGDNCNGNDHDGGDDDNSNGPGGDDDGDNGNCAGENCNGNDNDHDEGDDDNSNGPGGDGDDDGNENDSGGGDDDDDGNGNDSGGGDDSGNDNDSSGGGDGDHEDGGGDDGGDDDDGGGGDDPGGHDD